MDDFWFALGLFALFVAAYFVLMFLKPEWVGMSGRETQKILEHHQSEDDDTPRT